MSPGLRLVEKLCDKGWEISDSLQDYQILLDEGIYSLEEVELLLLRLA